MTANDGLAKSELPESMLDSEAYVQLGWQAGTLCIDGDLSAKQMRDLADWLDNNGSLWRKP